MATSMLTKSLSHVQTVHKCLPALWTMQTRTRVNNKHWHPKWKKERKAKVLKIDLPDFDKLRMEQKMSPDEMRSHMKREGRLPPRTFTERALNISCTGGIIEEYVPPEGDGKQSIISTTGAKQRLTGIEKKGKSFMQLRKIRKYEEEFDLGEFAQQAHDIYVEAHDLLQNYKDNEDRLHDLVTEKAYPEMIFGLEFKTLRWRFLESIEPPRAVHVRTMDMMSKENMYGQVTIRFHTKQVLAMYDRFGRLMFGSEDLIKNVLEYVVFEKHLSNVYGDWRIHSKIIPDWLPPAQPAIRTYRKPVFENIEDIEPSESTEEGLTESDGSTLVSA